MAKFKMGIEPLLLLLRLLGGYPYPVKLLRKAEGKIQIKSGIKKSSLISQESESPPKSSRFWKGYGFILMIAVIIVTGFYIKDMHHYFLHKPEYKGKTDLISSILLTLITMPLLLILLFCSYYRHDILFNSCLIFDQAKYHCNIKNYDNFSNISIWVFLILYLPGFITTCVLDIDPGTYLFVEGLKRLYEVAFILLCAKIINTEASIFRSTNDHFKMVYSRLHCKDSQHYNTSKGISLKTNAIEEIDDAPSPMDTSTWIIKTKHALLELSIAHRGFITYFSIPIIIIMFDCIPSIIVMLFYTFMHTSQAITWSIITSSYIVMLMFLSLIPHQMTVWVSCITDFKNVLAL